jgi:DNA-binding NtrC family response regulator
VVATSEVDLAEAVSEGRFRGDLWERLCGLEIRLPPLREREDDIVGLAQHFLRTLSAQQGGEVKRLSTAAVDLLQAHGWPGNVSELKRSMESASLLCSGPEIQPEHLPDDVRAETASGRIFTLRLDDTTEVPLREVVRQFEDELIEWALRRAGGVPSRAAALLGLPRTTLQSKLARRRS